MITNTNFKMFQFQNSYLQSRSHSSRAFRSVGWTVRGIRAHRMTLRQPLKLRKGWKTGRRTEVLRSACSSGIPSWRRSSWRTPVMSESLSPLLIWLNKLERLSHQWNTSSNKLPSSLCNKTYSCYSYHRACVLSFGFARLSDCQWSASTQSIRLDQKCVLVTNTLTYYAKKHAPVKPLLLSHLA